MPPREARKTQFYSMLASAASGTRVEGRHHPSAAQRLGEFNTDQWALPHRRRPRGTAHPRRDARQGTRARNLWFAEASRNGAFPLDDRVLLEIALTERPQIAAPREMRYPDTAEVPEKQSVNIRNRSSLGAFVDIRNRVRRECCSPRRALRQARPLRQGHRLTVQFRGPGGAEDRRHGGHPDGEDLILAASFEKDGETAGVAPASCTTATGKVGEAHQEPSPGNSPSPVRALHRTRQRRPSPTTTRRVAVSLHRGRIKQVSERERRALPEPGARGRRCSCANDRPPRVGTERAGRVAPASLPGREHDGEARTRS
jgi:hypothetical protein